MVNKNDAAVFVLWQSLVVGAYRDFFYELARITGWPIALAAPHRFRELGNQPTACEPFKTDRRTIGYRLRVVAPHAQAVFFLGLRRLLRAFFRQTTGRKVFLCIAEPYSITALLAWVIARVAIGKNFLFVTYAAQNIVKRFPLPLRIVQGFIYRRSDAILVVGKTQATVLQQQGYEGRLIPFPLWYNSQLFGSTSKQVPEDNHRSSCSKAKIRIAFCGNMSLEKGVFDLLDCFKDHLSHRYNDLQLTLIGGGARLSDTMEACRTLQSLGLDVKHMGPQPASKIPKILSRVDILVVPSRTTPHWKEQFGRITVEGMAAGAVVLGSDSGETPHVIGRTDRTFREGDPNDLAKKILMHLELMYDPGVRRSMRVAQQRYAAEHYSDRSLAQHFASHLRSRIFER